MVKSFLTDHDIPFTLINIDHDEAAALRVEQWNDGNRMVPTVDVDGTIMTNPSPTQLRQALGL